MNIQGKQLDAIQAFAKISDYAANRDDNEVIQVSFAKGGKMRTVSAQTSTTDKVKGHDSTLLNAFHRRSKGDVERNNFTRTAILDMLKDMYKAETVEDLPESVQNALKVDDFDNKGRPLSARRIKAISRALNGGVGLVATCSRLTRAAVGNEAFTFKPLATNHDPRTIADMKAFGKRLGELYQTDLTPLSVEHRHPLSAASVAKEGHLLNYVATLFREKMDMSQSYLAKDFFEKSLASYKNVLALVNEVIDGAAPDEKEAFMDIRKALVAMFRDVRLTYRALQTIEKLGVSQTVERPLEGSITLSDVKERLLGVKGDHNGKSLNLDSVYDECGDPSKGVTDEDVVGCEDDCVRQVLEQLRHELSSSDDADEEPFGLKLPDQPKPRPRLDDPKVLIKMKPGAIIASIGAQAAREQMELGFSPSHFVKGSEEADASNVGAHEVNAPQGDE